MSEKKQKIIPLSLGVLAMSLAIGYLVFAWTGPSANPPDQNVPAPINVGTTTQYKAGALGIGGLFTTYDQTLLAVSGGKVGIGTTGPDKKLTIMGSCRIDEDPSNGGCTGHSELYLWRTQSDCSCGDNQVGIGRNTYQTEDEQWYTSDACCGHAAIVMTNNQIQFKAIGGVGGCGSDTTMSEPSTRMVIDYTSGNVGIGTTTPGAKLDIVGDVKVSFKYKYNYTRDGWISGNATPRCSCDTSNFFLDCPDTFYTNTDEGYECYDQTFLGSYKYPRNENPPALYINFDTGNVGIGTTNPAYKLDVAGDIRTTGNLQVSGKTNIVNPLTNYESWNFSGWDAVGECVNFTPAQAGSYSAMHVLVRVDFVSDVSSIAFYTQPDCGGMKIPVNMDIQVGHSRVLCWGVEYYMPSYTSVILSTAVRSAKIIGKGGCALNKEVNPNIVIDAYFR